MKEHARIRFYEGYWLVEVLSAVSRCWIIQGEHRTKAAAERDLQSFL